MRYKRYSWFPRLVIPEWKCIGWTSEHLASVPWATVITEDNRIAEDGGFQGQMMLSEIPKLTCESERLRKQAKKGPTEQN